MSAGGVGERNLVGGGDPQLVARMLGALSTESSETVRPALTRTLAAYGTDPRVRDALNGLAATFMGYHGVWDSTDQIPERAVREGILDRFGTLDNSDGGDSYRYSGSFEWQRTRNNASTKVSATRIVRFVADSA